MAEAGIEATAVTAATGWILGVSSLYGIETTILQFQLNSMLFH